MKRIAGTIAACFVIAGCAATYVAPTEMQPVTSLAIPGSPAKLMDAAKQALVADGFQITSADSTAGVLSTAPRPMRLTPFEADCGTTMGLNYLKDNRTSTTIAYGVVIKGSDVRVVATMSGTYLPGNDTQSITLTCVSKGVLEHKLLTQIAALAQQ